MGGLDGDSPALRPLAGDFITGVDARDDHVVLFRRGGYGRLGEGDRV